jgi:hypothetical protein
LPLLLKSPLPLLLLFGCHPLLNEEDLLFAIAVFAVAVIVAVWD